MTQSAVRPRVSAETLCYSSQFDLGKGVENSPLKRRVVKHYCKTLGYLGGALKLTPNTDTILAESARAAADFAKERTLARLGAEIEKALS
jgi:hypothetical protein